MDRNSLLRSALLSLLLISLTNCQKSYESIVTVCSGSEYSMGCGTGDGSVAVMNFTKIYVQMNVLDDATRCVEGLCQFDIFGPNNFAEAWEKPNLASLFTSIQANCQGKGHCVGRIPLSAQLSASLSLGSAGGVCGFDVPEYIAKLVLTSECVLVSDATVPTIPTTATTPTTQPPTEPSTEPTTESTTKQPTTQPTTEQPASSTVKPATTEKPKDSSSEKPKPPAVITDAQTATAMNPGWITLIVFGVLAGLAIVACICVAVYIFCIKTRSVQLKTPIDDQEMGTPTEEKQPL